MTDPAMAVAELAKKGPDVDVLRQMVQCMAQRLTEVDVKALCGATYDEKQPGRHKRLSRASALPQTTNALLLLGEAACGRLRHRKPQPLSRASALTHRPPTHCTRSCWLSP